MIQRFYSGRGPLQKQLRLIALLMQELNLILTDAEMLLRKLSLAGLFEGRIRSLPEEMGLSNT